MLCIRRILQDIQDAQGQGSDGVYYFADEQNLHVGYGLIVGNANTPYAGGFYLIKFEFPLTYPCQPPKCTYLRFCEIRQNPNFHDSGQICLSRLNTWDSASSELHWTPNMGIYAVLTMIKYIVLCDEPLQNEPHLLEPLTPEASTTYNEVVRYWNARANIVDILTDLQTGTRYELPASIRDQLISAIKNEVQTHLVQYTTELQRAVQMQQDRHYKCEYYQNAKAKCDYQQVLTDFQRLYGRMRIKVHTKQVANRPNPPATVLRTRVH